MVPVAVTSSRTSIELVGASVTTTQGLRSPESPSVVLFGIRYRNPQAAEHVAMAIAADIVTDIATPISDCLGVVRIANSNAVAQLRPNFKFAGVSRHAMARPSAG